MYELDIEYADQIKILYVDDCRQNLQLFLITNSNKYEVVTAEYGQDALVILKEQNDIDVVISDYHMPLMDGLEFITEARKIKSDIPFYLLSSSLLTEEIMEALQSKLIDSYFRKPLDKSQLLDEICGFYKKLNTKNCSYKL